MRISWFIAIEAFLLSIVFAKTEDPNRLEDLTTRESVSPSSVNSTKEDFATNYQHSEEIEKPRNVRHTQNILPPIFADPHWPSIESPIFFDTSLQDKEKTKLVLIEPFFREKKMEKVQKGLWGWLKKIFANNNKDKEKNSQGPVIGQGPLIGPVKVPGMGDNVYIRAADAEHEANHVVIHLMMKKPAEKEIKFESLLPLGNFDTVHELPVESASYQTIVSPHFSHMGLFDKSHFPGIVDTSWSSVPLSSSSVHIPSVKENFYANPSFFRKHSTVNEGTEFSNGLTKDDEETQQFTAWAQTQQYGSPVELQVPFYGSEDNGQFTSAREDISNIQRAQNSGLEISENKEPLPLYPPLFNSSFGLNNSNNKNQIYVTNNRDVGNEKSSSGPKRESQPYPGLGAYRTEFKIVPLSKNITHEIPEMEYISQIGIQEVEAPNLTQAENRGIYQISEIDNDKSKMENSKKIRNSHLSDYGNYGLTNSDNSDDSISKLNETDETLKTISASYPWEYQISKDKFTTLKPEKDKKDISQSSSKSKYSISDVGKKNTRFRNRMRNRNRGVDIKQTNHTEVENSQKNKVENLPETGKIEEEKKSDDELEKPLTAEKVKEFFIKESKRFEEVLKTVENESKANEEETNDTRKVYSETNRDRKEELKIDTKETNNAKEENSNHQETKIYEKEKIEKELKTIKETGENEELTIEENSKAIKEELDAVKKDLKAVKQELEKSKTNKNETQTIQKIEKFATESTQNLQSINENLKNQKEKLKSIRKVTKTLEEKSKSPKKETIMEKFKPPEDDIPLKMLFNTREKSSSEEKVSSEKENPQEGKKLNQTEDTPAMSRIANNLRTRKIKKSNSTARFELKKPRISMLDLRFKSKLQNATGASKIQNNSTVKIESSSITTTPRSHITRIYGKNRASEKLKLKAKKEKIFEIEENRKNDTSKENSMKIEKQKIRINKFSPRTRNFKLKIANSTDEVKIEK